VQNMADNHKDDLLILQYLTNKALQKTQTALFSFSIRLSRINVSVLGPLVFAEGLFIKRRIFYTYVEYIK
jgi:hypothetical protein